MENKVNEIYNGYLANGQGPFLRSGDIGFIVDKQLYIQSRLKDLIIIRGKNYYPQDIELSVERCDPLIRPGCITAFSIDKNDQECLVILVEVRPSFSLKISELLINKIKSVIIKEHGIKVYSIYLLKAHTIEKTTSGKLRRSTMREMYLNKELEPLNSSI